MSIVRKECIHVMANLLSNQARNLPREDDAEALFRNAPAHHFFGLGIKYRTSRQNSGAELLELCRKCTAFLPRHNYGGCSVTKQPRRDQVRRRQILFLDSQGT